MMSQNSGSAKSIGAKALGVMTLAFTALAVVAFLGLLWISHTGLPFMQQRRPGLDHAPEAGPATGPSPVLQGKLVSGPGQPAELPGNWPCFRGVNRDGIALGAPPLARQWGPQEPAVLWSVEVGEGYAGATVWQGRVYLLDYDQQEQADALRCLSLADGREIWRYAYPIKIKRNHGMSRTVPAVTDQYAVSFGPKCHVLCVDSTSGEFRWGLDLVRDYGVEVPQWYAGQCPLIEGDRMILGVGGPDALLMAVDCATGAVLWKTPNPRGWKMTHSSVVPVELGDRRQYVYSASGGVVGVDATDGRILWETDAWQIAIATIASPVPAGSDRLFLSGGYNAGSMMLQVQFANEQWVANPLFRLEPSQFGATQQTPILYQDHLYGVRPDGQMVCLDRNGRMVWTSGGGDRFGLGPFLIADGLVIAMDDSGLLQLMEATPTAYRPLARAQVLNGHDCWGPLALAGSRLLARDLTRMVCLELSGGIR